MESRTLSFRRQLLHSGRHRADSTTPAIIAVANPTFPQARSRQRSNGPGPGLIRRNVRAGFDERQTGFPSMTLVDDVLDDVAVCFDGRLPRRSATTDVVAYRPRSRPREDLRSDRWTLDDRRRHRPRRESIRLHRPHRPRRAVLLGHAARPDLYTLPHYSRDSGLQSRGTHCRGTRIVGAVGIYDGWYVYEIEKRKKKYRRTFVFVQIIRHLTMERNIRAMP